MTVTHDGRGPSRPRDVAWYTPDGTPVSRSLATQASKLRLLLHEQGVSTAEVPQYVRDAANGVFR